MSQPQTAAGKALLDRLAWPWKSGTRGYDAMVEEVLPAIIAIEREAAGHGTCGAAARGGPCVLPRGHNMGSVDIPANHRAVR